MASTTCSSHAAAILLPIPRMYTPTLYSVGRLQNLTEFAVRLEAQLGWRPAYWITQPELEEAVAARFPDVIRHDFTDANRGINDPCPLSMRVSSPPDLMTRDGHLLRQGLEIVARHVLGRALGANQQADFFFDRLGYALGVTRALDLQVFVLNSTPHSVIDFCFYMAFRLLGRKVRMLHLTGFRGMQVVLSDAEGPPLGMDRLGTLNGDALSPEGRAELLKLLDRGQDHTPWYVTLQEEREQAQETRNAVADELIDEGRYPPGMIDFDRPAERLTPLGQRSQPSKAGVFARLFRRTAPQPDTPSFSYEDAFKRRFQERHDLPMRRAFAYRSEGFAAPEITWRHYYTYRDWVLLTKRRWKRDYNRITQNFDLEAATAGPYVYFALHYQPERTTCPEGGLFSDQTLALRTIVQALPEGWRVLVKEHPSQFLWQTEGELGRWDGFYDQISALGPVDLVPLNVSSERLISSAAAVVTITGTVGWEACLAGTAAIVMAQPWYAAPGLTLFARSSTEMREAFAQILAGWRPEPQAIATHLARIEQLGRICYMNPSHAALYAKLSDDDNTAALAELFINAERLSQGAA